MPEEVCFFLRLVTSLVVFEHCASQSELYCSYCSTDGYAAVATDADGFVLADVLGAVVAD